MTALEQKREALRIPFFRPPKACRSMLVLPIMLGTGGRLGLGSVKVLRAQRPIAQGSRRLLLRSVPRITGFWLRGLLDGISEEIRVQGQVLINLRQRTWVGVAEKDRDGQRVEPTLEGPGRPGVSQVVERVLPAVLAGLLVQLLPPLVELSLLLGPGRREGRLVGESVALEAGRLLDRDA